MMNPPLAVHTPKQPPNRLGNGRLSLRRAYSNPRPTAQRQVLNRRTLWSAQERVDVARVDLVRSNAFVGDKEHLPARQPKAIAAVSPRQSRLVESDHDGGDVRASEVVEVRVGEPAADKGDTRTLRARGRPHCKHCRAGPCSKRKR